MLVLGVGNYSSQISPKTSKQSEIILIYSGCYTVPDIARDSLSFVKLVQVAQFYKKRDVRSMHETAKQQALWLNC